jgi:NAD(P)-dependent dehydrogenase (short-subunit alcohol dehydrogenase family)
MEAVVPNSLPATAYTTLRDRPATFYTATSLYFALNRDTCIGHGHDTESDLHSQGVAICGTVWVMASVTPHEILTGFSMTTCQRMKRKRVLVTGSGTGIGKEVGLEFSREGGDVVFHYSGSREGAMAAVEQARRDGAAKVTAIQADFRQANAPGELAAKAIEFLGGIDILVNNAGITMNVPFEDVSAPQFDTLFSVNFRAMYFVTQAAVRTMLQQGGGVIVNIGSIHAYEAYPEHTVYAATKGAIAAFTRVLAIELAPKGIRVNAVVPGAVEVEAHHRIFPNYDATEFGKAIPTGFVGQPIDIAKAVLFLASDDARYIVGQSLIVDGGTTSWMPFGEGYRQPPGGQFGRGYVPGL